MARKILIVAALCALSAMSAASAFSANLREGSATGSLIPVGSTLHASLKTGTTATLTTALGSSHCSEATFHATVLTNTAGTNATSTVSSLTFGTPAPAAPCAGEIFGATIQNAELSTTAADPTVTDTSSTSVSQTTTTVIVHLTNGTNCTMTSPSSFNGTTSNTDNSLAFSNIATSSLCGNGSFYATFAPVVTSGTTTPIFNG